MVRDLKEIRPPEPFTDVLELVRKEVSGKAILNCISISDVGLTSGFSSRKQAALGSCTVTQGKFYFLVHIKLGLMVNTVAFRKECI